MRILSSVLLLLTPWSVTRQSLSVEFSRREYWSGLPSPPPRDTRSKKKKKKEKILEDVRKGSLEEVSS